MIAAIAGRPRLVRSARGGVPHSAVRTALAAGDWRCERVLPTVSDTAVVLVRTGDGQAGLLKLAVSPSGVASLRGEHGILGRLAAQDRLGGWRGLIPAPLAAGDAGGTEYLLTTRLPGQDARLLPVSQAGALTRAAFGAIAPLHRAAALTTVDAALLDSWLAPPGQLLRSALPRAGRQVEKLLAAVRDGLAGARVPLGWTHGDFHPGNVLTGEQGRVTGIVDWDQARERDLTAADLAFWLLTVPGPGRLAEFGGRVTARLRRRGCWTPAEARLLAGAAPGEDPAPGEGPAPGAAHLAGAAGWDEAAGRALLLLAWLRHVAGNLAKSGRYASSPLWLHRNVRPVLRQVAR